MPAQSVLTKLHREKLDATSPRHALSGSFDSALSRIAPSGLLRMTRAKVMVFRRFGFCKHKWPRPGFRQRSHSNRMVLLGNRNRHG
jgi:hypothetical protein